MNDSRRQKSGKRRRRNPVPRPSMKGTRIHGPTAKIPENASVKGRITRRGWALIAAAAGLLALGTFLNDSAPILIALFAPSVLMGSYLLGWVNLRGLEFVRKAPAEVHAGRDFDVEITVHNRKALLASHSLSLTDATLRFAERASLFPKIAPGEGRRLRARTRLVERGTEFHGPALLSSSYPLGLWKFRSRFNLPLRLFSFPRAVVPRELLGLREEEASQGEALHVQQVDEQGNFSAVREFRAGDRLSAVHWPASARHGRLAVRERDQPSLQATSIVFHSCSGSGEPPGPESFEHSLELLAGVLQFSKSKGTPLDLTASFRGWETFTLTNPGHLEDMLRWLAGATYHPVTELKPLQHAIRRLPGDHQVFVVSNMPLDQWEPELGELGRPVVCLDNRTLRLHGAVPVKNSRQLVLP